MKKSINANKGEAIFQFGKKDPINITLLGMDNETICYLALHGLHDILNHRKDPKKSFTNIQNGNIKHKKPTSAIIKAIATVHELSEEAATKAWINLSRKEKMAIRYEDTRVKQALLDQEKVTEISIPV